jgi:hypothetical protein
MNPVTLHGLAQLLAADTPVLPSSGLMQTWLQLGWAVALAWLGSGLVGRYWPGKPLQKVTAAVVLAVWAFAPAPYSSAYWLGLAFQAPSVLTVLLCARLLYQDLAPSGRERGGTLVPVLALIVALAGWALLLDTFALLPVQLYAWGFSPVALGLVLMCVLLPWVALSSPMRPCNYLAWGGAVALMVFVLWRLPTGNVWDAVLDPWLWVALHFYLGRRVWLRVTKRLVVFP